MTLPNVTKKADLAAGIYRLKVDVANPHPDRRRKFDWRKLPVWKQGMRFRVEVDRLVEEFDIEGNTLRLLSGAPSGVSGGTVQSGSPEWAALLPALEPTAAKARDLLDDMGCTSDRARADVLVRLLDSGLVDIEAVRRVKVELWGGGRV